jgi:hypothetical protein
MNNPTLRTPNSTAVSFPKIGISSSLNTINLAIHAFGFGPTQTYAVNSPIMFNGSFLPYGCNTPDLASLVK